MQFLAFRALSFAVTSLGVPVDFPWWTKELE